MPHPDLEALLALQRRIAEADTGERRELQQEFDRIVNKVLSGKPIGRSELLAALAHYCRRRDRSDEAHGDLRRRGDLGK